MFIDTHAHLTFPEFELDLPAVISRAKAAKLEAILNIALDDKALNQSLKMAEDYPAYLFTAAGIHPHEASQWDEAYFNRLKKLAGERKIIAIGEIGLDYHYKLSPIEEQKMVFRQLLQLAQEVDLPAIIHSREAAHDTFTLLREENRGKLKGVLHCFSGDKELGKGALEMGLYLSFTGNITFGKAEIIRTAAKETPLDRILIETDCPFLAPQEFRGKRNEPAYVVKVAEKIAALKNIPLEEAAIATTENARQLFF